MNEVTVADKTSSKTRIWQIPSQKFREIRLVFRQSGVRGVIRHFGWKLLAFLFVYYLVRDVTLYILLPWYIAKKLAD